MKDMLLGIAILVIATVFYCAVLGALGRRRPDAPRLQTSSLVLPEMPAYRRSTSTGTPPPKQRITRAQRDRNRDRMARKSRARNRKH